MKFLKGILGAFKPVKVPSYHNVVVYCDGRKYVISDYYGLELTCCRTAGWRLWNTWNTSSMSQHKLIGGEYDGKDFRIEVDGKVIAIGHGK